MMVVSCEVERVENVVSCLRVYIEDHTFKHHGDSVEDDGGGNSALPNSSFVYKTSNDLASHCKVRSRLEVQHMP